jgi:hypothetical protein
MDKDGDHPFVPCEATSRGEAARRDYPFIPGGKLWALSFYTWWINMGTIPLYWWINRGTIPLYLVKQPVKVSRDYPFIPGE